MAKQEALGKTTPEQMKAFTRATSEQAKLPQQREESLKRVLGQELDIAARRKAALDDYFDLYSNKLEQIRVASRKLIDDTHEILNQKIADSYRALSSDINKLSQQISGIAKQSTNQPTTKNTGSGSISYEKQIGSLDHKVHKLNQSSYDVLYGQLETRELISRLFGETQEILSYTAENNNQNNGDRLSSELLKSLALISGAGAASGESGATAEAADGADVPTANAVPPENQVKVETYNTEAARAKLTPTVTVFEDIKALDAARRAREELDAALASGDRERIKSAGKSYNEVKVLWKAHLKELEAENVTYIQALISQEEAAQKKYLQLELARSQAQEQQVTRITEFRLKELDKVLAAELAAVDAINQANAEIAYVSTDAGAADLGDMRARTVNAEEDLKSQQEVAAQIVKFRQALEDQARAESGGKLLAEDAARIEKLVAEEHASRLANLNELTQKRFETESRVRALAKLNEEDPALAVARDARIAKEIADLERQYRLETNSILDADAKERIRQQVEEKYAYESEAIQELADEYAEATKVEHFKETNSKAGSTLEAAKTQYIVAQEYKLRKKYNRQLTDAELAAVRLQADLKYKLNEKNVKQLIKIQNREDEKAKRANIAATDQAIAHATQFGGFSKEDNFLSRMKSLKDMAADAGEGETGKTIAAGLAVATKALSSLVAQLNTKIDDIASKKGNIDTRLQGSNNQKSSGSYWDQLTKDMMSVGAVTPFFKQEDFAKNIEALVERGISFDLKQRAFLMTIQEKIANTFNVADGTLLRLIRIQQEDSTAGRLGMESALNTYLNNMYETSEYLSDVAASVRSSLEEMEALMSGVAATEVEYQVQKWMGSLYSVGMSQEAVQGIAGALGQIAAGQIDALTNGNGAGNLLVMAANNAGLSISDILTNGLDAKQTNDLLQSAVNYLADLADASKDSKVVQQQLASVYGVKASDLRAATNLAVDDTIKDIYGQYKTYDNLLKQLNQMAGTMYQRTSIGEMMTNIWENGQYSLASSMANNPVAYLMYKMADLLDQTTGGIALPFLNVYGFGVDLETTVADLMRVASMSTGILGNLGPMISGLASSFSGQAMLTKMGIESGNGLTVTPRGSSGAGAGEMPGGGAKTTSESGYVGNSSSSDVKDSTIQGAEDDKKQQMIEAKEEAETTQFDIISMNVLKIYELLDDVASGKRNLSVKVNGYGLTSSTALTDSAQGGVNGLLSNTPTNSSNSLSGGFNNGAGSTSGNTALNSGAATGSTGGISGSTIDLGGWTMM